MTMLWGFRNTKILLGAWSERRLIIMHPQKCCCKREGVLAVCRWQTHAFFFAWDSDQSRGAWISVSISVMWDGCSLQLAGWTYCDIVTHGSFEEHHCMHCAPVELAHSEPRYDIQTDFSEVSHDWLFVFVFVDVKCKGVSALNKTARLEWICRNGVSET